MMGVLMQLRVDGSRAHAFRDVIYSAYDDVREMDRRLEFMRRRDEIYGTKGRRKRWMNENVEGECGGRERRGRRERKRVRRRGKDIKRRGRRGRGRGRNI